MDVYTIAILISFVVYIAVGNYAGRKVKHLEDYFVAGRQAPTLLIVGTLVASFLSTNTFLGETGMAYSNWAGAWLIFPPIAVAGYVLGALFFGRYLRRSRALTVGDFFGRRFDRRVQVVAGVTIIVGLGGYLLAVTQGAAMLLEQLTPLTYTQGLIAAWLSYTLFTLYSGSRGVVLTDTLMFGLFAAVSVAAVIYIVSSQGGWSVVFEGLVGLESKPGLMSWHGMTGPAMRWVTPADFLIWSLILGVAWGLVVAISPWQSSRYLMAKSEHVVVRSACLAALSVVLIQKLLFVSASTVNLHNPGIEPKEEVMIWAALNLLPPLLGALMLAGVMAAALSSASTFLSLVGFSISNDIAAHEGANDRFMLRLSRWMMLVAGVITLVIGLLVPQRIFEITYFVGTVFASSWGPVAFMSVWSDRITSRAALWGMVLGFLGNVVPKLLATLGWISLPTILDPILIGGVVSLVAVLALSNRAGVTDGERQYRLSLHQRPSEEREAAEIGITLRTIVLLGGFGVVVSLALIGLYVLPYQILTDTLRGGVALDWTSGEAWSALGWAGLFVPVAALAWVVVRRSYS
jgi:Na+/proline symporter